MPFPMLIPAFFLSSWLLMVFWGMISPDVGVKTIGYPTAMLATIGLWLVVFPVATRGGSKAGKGGRKMGGFAGPFGKDGKKRSASASSSAETLDEDEIELNSSFSGIARRLTSQQFRGGKVNANFGGVQLDLRSAQLASDGARLDIRAFVGGVDIQVPVGWDVQADISATIGGVNDERDGSDAVTPDSPVLRITGSATLGGVNIKN